MAERKDKAEASAPRKRALVSCDRCKLRRARCIRANPEEPCADCKLSGVECESKLPRKQRVYGSVETLSLRYRALESLVKGLFPHDNVQDLNTIFQIAATRNISMPANDDYTPADIFNDSSQQTPSNSGTQRQQERDYQPSILHRPQQQQHSALHQPTTYVGLASSGSSSKDSQLNPFSTVQQPLRQAEELISTRHGASHYFGPSSSFRLATTIKALVARCKAVPGTNLQAPRNQNSGSGRSDPSSRAPPSYNTTSINPSDEEYVFPGNQRLQSPSRVGSKRSRSQMEGRDDRWEDMEGRSRPGTIADLLPPRPLSDALVSAYFDHVHIYLPLFHRSMFQLKLEQTYSRQANSLHDCTDMGWLICLAMVFSFGCQQLHDYDPEQSHILQLKYLSFVKTCFRQLLTTTSLANVQAFMLLSIHHHFLGQKSTSWLFVGLGARMVSPPPHENFHQPLTRLHRV